MSKAKYTHDMVATIGTYKDPQTGEEKKRFVTLGKVFTREDGNQSFKLDTIPVDPQWSGWVSIYPAKDRQQEVGRNSGGPTQSAHNQSKSNGYQPEDPDCPF